MDISFDESSLLAATPKHLNPGNTVTPTLRQRARSFEPPSTNRRQAVHTPVQSVPRPPNSAHRGLSASGRRRNNAPTPHAKAAYKTIDQRRAAMTPGKRRISQARRDSSHDILSLLSRRLAPQSDIIRSSSPGLPGSAKQPLQSVEEDDDDDLPIDRPNLTLPLYEDEDDDLIPPRSSILEGDLTTENPRRAYSERPSRMSLGATRLSDYYNANDFELEQTAGQAFFPPLGVDDADMDVDRRDDTYERIDDDVQRESLAPRPSDFGFEVPLDADPEPSTFVMPLAQSSPERLSPLQEAATGHLAGAPDNPPLEVDTDDEAPRADWGDMVDQASDDDVDVAEAGEGDNEGADATLTAAERLDAAQRGKRKSKPGWRVSKHGHAYPPFPQATVKRVAEEFARTSGIPNPRIGKDTLAAFQQASDWFFEQVAEDLAAYAAHAGRKTINEGDMELVMKRQRQITSTSTIFSLATQHLPQELVRELRMPPPTIPKKKRKGASRAGEGREEAGEA